LAKTRSELDELKAQMASLMAQRKPGRPRKEDVDVQYDDASVGSTGN
jgi:BMFP domain-containing protein YqiC